MRILFTLFVTAHGLIHLMGYTKAFGLANIQQLTKEISRPAGIFWLLCVVLFISAAILFLLKKEWWLFLAIPAIMVSQVLIIMSWQDAKYGTIPNFLILLVIVTAIAQTRFNNMVNIEIKMLLEQPTVRKEMITDDKLNNLPAVVQTWLRKSGIIGKPVIQFVRLKQMGEMRTKQNSKWMMFSARQYFAVQKPQFVWQTTVQVLPMITLSGRDKFKNGEGHLLIKLLSLFTVAKSGNDEKMNSATMIRYLAEISWFPSAALSEFIRWESVDSFSAKAIMDFQGVRAEGIFHFNPAGDFIRFTADRFMGNGKNAKPEKWLVEVTGYKEFHGYRIPYKNKVTWQLQTGDFNWANIEITEIDFNFPEIYR